ncbi:type II secretion system F family protein [Ornithinimicrobium sp. INDO-MA30-4]|nr:type II secretion system F family protein [Ornithinimicrobium sp. INDO-MA30-4]
MNPVWLGALLGAIFALGILLVWRGLPATRGTDLVQRIEPYLDRAPRRSRLLQDPTVPLRWSDIGRPLGHRAAGWIDRLFGGRDSVSLRLTRAGLTDDVDGFRLQQVLWGVSGMVLAAAGGSLVWWLRGASPWALFVLVCCAGLGGVIARDSVLTSMANRREKRLMAEFPAMAELLALAVTAGEGTMQALERVSRLSTGELAGELELALGQARTGMPLPQALEGMGQRTGLTALSRFVDGLVVAMQRGTPLGEVLRAQAADARAAARQALIEEGGKREIYMMVPVVFLVLPVTVLFAVYPGLSLLQITV